MNILPDLACIAAALAILAAGGLTVGWLTGSRKPAVEVTD